MSTYAIRKDQTLAAPLNSFPVELLDSILGLVIKSLVQSIATEPLCSILRQYRALISMCKAFKFVLDNAAVRVVIQHRRYYYSTREFEALFLEPNTPIKQEWNWNQTEILTNWANVFKTVQKLSIDRFKIDKDDNYATAVGKFWLNPMVTPDDVTLHDYGPYDLRLVICLRPLFYRNRRRPTENERKRVLNLRSPYRPGEIVHVIPSSDNQICACSFRTWGIGNNDRKRPDWTNALSSWRVAKQVSEWWVWKKSLYCRDDTYILGYHGKNAWLVNLQTGGIYTNFPKRPQWR